MFDKIKTPEELFTHKLGAALKMEHTVLEMLDELEHSAHEETLKRQFRHHADETKQQIANIERAFEVLGREPSEEPCPAIEGLDKEGKQNIKQTEDSLVDHVVLAGAAETEHHEIAVYEGLLTHASAMGHSEVVSLLEQNLEQEKHTLAEVTRASEARAHELAGTC